MFTGIVEEIGKINHVVSGKLSGEISVHAKTVLDTTKIGDSIAVNGVCLTVTKLLTNGFTADVMPETLRRTNLGKLVPGSRVNLERAMPVNGRFGGHIVAGHVDGTGKILDIRRDDTAIWYTVGTGQEILQYIVEKGSITIDGISLTVAAITNIDFSISAIPHTIAQTALQKRTMGDVVNLETDIIGKYVEKLLHPIQAQQGKSVISREFLSQHGF